MISPARVLTLPGLLILAPVVFSFLSAMAAAQQEPLERTFTAGAVSSYHITLSVHSGVSGQQPVQIGAKAYVKPFSREVGNALRWTATRRVVAVAADGSAEVEETLEEFAGPGDSALIPEEEAAKQLDDETRRLAAALREALAAWKEKRTLRYRETRSGQLLDLKPECAPPLGEAAPPVLTLWLLRALRPAAALPATPIRFAEPWRVPRNAQLTNWAEVRGSESGEWLEAQQAAEPAVRLHIVQQLSGTVVSGAEKPPEGAARARFHGESLNTVSLTDGRLLAAARSATREITWRLAPVEGLPDPPEFRGSLFVEVVIQACDETPCLSAGRSALRQQR